MILETKRTGLTKSNTINLTNQRINSKYFGWGTNEASSSHHMGSIRRLKNSKSLKDNRFFPNYSIKNVDTNNKKSDLNDGVGLQNGPETPRNEHNRHHSSKPTQRTQPHQQLMSTKISNNNKPPSAGVLKSTSGAEPLIQIQEGSNSSAYTNESRSSHYRRHNHPLHFNAFTADRAKISELVNKINETLGKQHTMSSPFGNILKPQSYGANFDYQSVKEKRRKAIAVKVLDKGGHEEWAVNGFVGVEKLIRLEKRRRKMEQRRLRRMLKEKGEKERRGIIFTDLPLKLEVKDNDEDGYSESDLSDSREGGDQTSRKND